MRPTSRLLQNTRITLFTRVNCSLCDTAKNTIAKLADKKPFLYSEIDVMAPQNKTWKDVYEFDVPVLHVQRVLSKVNDDRKTLSNPKKLFHRFTEEEIEKAMKEVAESI
ncbi:glutaredoxin domain-containing protein [Paracoccidioides lutzii Pb01]|uniref:Glutaredoxin-like protein n=1 Tax=Paracoccidioides lutzii (strain ATCC MYA-826 / Pb01) TaxID=502779 RepID=C1GY20_PARBA|nr:glutaredoxin domain-containing protein [Paracoccidioides lutzii Pb01]EEH41411.1 glutaredoxin domain-containing protein [Paracoccidioides lutzii Pb01]